MKIIKYFNRFTFLPVFNVFDFLCIMTISSLIVNHSWWWFLLYAVTMPLSATVQNIVQRSES